MLADKHLRTHTERDRVLQMRAHAQNRPAARAGPIFQLRISDFGFRISALRPQHDRQRRIASRAPQDHLAAHHHPRNRIVHVPDDGTVMHQEQIGDAAQSVQRLEFIRADRFVAQVAAGGHDGKGQQREQQW